MESGYKTIKSETHNAIFIVSSGVANSKLNEATDNIIKNTQASPSEIFPDARGLSFVLSTTLSKLRSLISLITHPHDLTKIEPTKR